MSSNPGVQFDQFAGSYDQALERGDLDGILMVAAQALERRTATREERFLEQENRTVKEVNALRAENAELKARLEALERRMDAARANETGAAASAAFARGE